MYNAFLISEKSAHHGRLVGDSAPQTLEYKKSPRQLLHCRGLIFCIVSADGSMLAAKDSFLKVTNLVIFYFSIYAPPGLFV